jgi:ABC-type sugar transport system ATPase subunit
MRGAGLRSARESTGFALVHLEVRSGGPRELRGSSSGWRPRAVWRRRAVARQPLSNLDAKLRQEMRPDRDLQRRLGITMIFVTHDQEEALRSPGASR